MIIPKIIHQIMHNFKAKYPPDSLTYVSPEVPEKWKKSPEEWKRLHPYWQYVLWDDLSSRRLIINYYPWFLSTYDNYKYPIQRVDAIRYFILHHFGGVYCDLDLYPVSSIDSYFPPSNVEVYFTYGSNCTANSFIASTKHAKFWNKVFDKLQNIHIPFYVKLSKHFTIMLTTGPMFLNNIVKNYNDGILGRLPNKFFDHELNDKDTDSILKSLDGMSWCGWDTHILNFLHQNLKASITVVVLLLIVIFLGLAYMSKMYRSKLKQCELSKIK